MIKKERQHSSLKSKQLFYQFEPSLDDDNLIKKECLNICASLFGKVQYNSKTKLQ